MPPKKQKQTAHNAFYYFMLEYKNNHGRSFNSMKEVADAAGPVWQRMDKFQRKPYEEQALMEKNKIRAVKLTSDGQNVEELENEEKMEQMRIQDVKQHIKHDIKLAQSRGELKNQTFFIIHINTFCYWVSGKKHIPAEIGVTAFSLEEGAEPTNTFHRLIKPGPLPTGYASEAFMRSDESHHIQPPLCDETENTVEEVYRDLKDFLVNRVPGSEGIPVLYAPEKEVKTVQNILDDWRYDYGGDEHFNVYNLQHMFTILRNTIAGGTLWPTETFAKRELEKDVYAYAKGICCEFHDTTNVPHQCSRSVVVRYAYVICDNCCPDLNIQLKPGYHVPKTAVSSGSRASSHISLASSNFTSTNLNPTVRDDDTDSVASFSTHSEFGGSTISEATVTDAVEDYPELGVSRGRRTYSETSSVASQSSTRRTLKSYAGSCTAGASGRQTNLPSSIINSMGRLGVESCSQNPGFNLNKNQFPSLGQRIPGSMGRGRRPKADA